jgi:hypothetical protein
MMHGSMNITFKVIILLINPLNAELNPICQLLALLGAHPILHISRIRVKQHFLRFIGRSDTAQFDIAILLPIVLVRCKVFTDSNI